eukprot:1141976-Pelagomonas_calceolata.AAC.4
MRCGLAHQEEPAGDNKMKGVEIGHTPRLYHPLVLVTLSWALICRALPFLDAPNGPCSAPKR